MDLIGFEISARLDTTPKLTNMFLRRPSHIRDISVVVDALALTTPMISLGGFEGAGCDIEITEREELSDPTSGAFSCSSMGFDLDLLIHHSMPMVHSLS